MFDSSTFSLTILALATGAVALCGRPFVVSWVKKGFFLSIAAVVMAQTYLAYAQYHFWQLVSPSKYLLPPYQPISYFLQYVGWRLFAPYALSLAVGIAFALAARWYNRRRDNQFFYDEEYWFMAMAIFLTGHPGWLLYLVALCAIMAIVLFFRLVILRKNEKLSFYYLWFPLALAVVALWKWAATFGILMKLQV